MSLRWVDTHCHLDAPEFGPQAFDIRALAATQGVAHCVLPAVQVANFDAVRLLAHQGGDSYCLGIHPLYVAGATAQDLYALDAELARHRDDPHLVAVGEIGLDYFVPALTRSPLREKQEDFYHAQLSLALRHGLPVVMHVRRSADRLLKHLRDVGQGGHVWAGIAHAFNGSLEQARRLVDLGFKLGFGGAVTYARAMQLRRLLQWVPLDALVLETDAPDMPPHWVYVTAEQRAAGAKQGLNTPGELPRIAAVVAQLRGIELAELAHISTANACAALPRLRALIA